MKKTLIIACMCLFFQSMITGQRMPTSFEEYEMAVSKLEEATWSPEIEEEAHQLEQGVDKSSFSKREKANLYHDLGVAWYNNLHRPKEAMALYQKALQIRKVLVRSGGNHQIYEGIIKGYHNIGLCLLDSDLSKAEQSLIEGLNRHSEYREQGWYDNPERRAKSYHALGQVYIKQGIMGKALQHLEKAEDIYKRSDTLLTSRFELAQIYNDISYLYQAWEVGKLAKNYAQQSVKYYLEIYHDDFGEEIDLLNKYGIIKSLVGAYNLLAIGYELEGELAAARNTFERMDRFIDQLESPWRQVHKVGRLNNLSIVERKAKRFAKALKLTEAALYLNRSMLTDDSRKEVHIRMANNYYNIGHTYLQQQEYQLAHQAFQHGIQLLAPNLDQDQLGNPTIAESSSEVLDYLELLGHLNGKARSLAGMQEMELARKTYELAVDLLTDIGRSQSDVSVKGRLSGLGKETYNGFIDLHFDLAESTGNYNHHWEAAFQLSERSKSFAVLGSNEEISVLSVREVRQKLLQDGHSLLEYFVGENNLYIWGITVNGFVALELAAEDTKTLQEEVDRLLFGLTTPSTVGNTLVEANVRLLIKAANQYGENAFGLYQKLVKPMERLLPLTDRWIIVPDEMLNKVPFETLLGQKPEIALSRRPDYSDYDYLLYRAAISYAYSASTLHFMQQLPAHRADQFFLGMAPSFDKQHHQYLATREGLDELTYNQPEIDSIMHTLRISGRAFKGEQATKQQFLEQFSQHRIFHFSSHAISDPLDGTSSFLVFYGEDPEMSEHLLFVIDILELQSNADMVVLSACETIGKDIWRGFGPQGPARGFAQIGTKSIISSLWNVNDASTRSLMQLFYAYLKAGKPKDVAMQQAKLDYLKNKQGVRRDIPYYWAAFLPVGDSVPLFETGAKWDRWLIGLGGLLLLIIFLSRKRS